MIESWQAADEKENCNGCNLSNNEANNCTHGISNYMVSVSISSSFVLMVLLLSIHMENANILDFKYCLHSLLPIWQKKWPCPQSLEMKAMSTSSWQKFSQSSNVENIIWINYIDDTVFLTKYVDPIEKQQSAFLCLKPRSERSMRFIWKSNITAFWQNSTNGRPKFSFQLVLVTKYGAFC